MQTVHLGNGIFLFKDAVNFDDAFFNSFMGRMYEFSPPNIPKIQDGSQMVLTDGGYEYPASHINTSPIRHTNTIYQGISDEDESFIKSLEDAIYTCLVKYCKSFPVVMETVTWRTRGYFIEYHVGQSIGAHSDCAIAYQPNSIIELNNAPLHNTLTTSVILNDDYEGGELRFAPWGISVTPPKGSILIYPSSFSGCHEVSAITAGKRFAYLSWFAHGSTSHLPIDSDSSTMESQYSWVKTLKDDVGYAYQETVHVGFID